MPCRNSLTAGITHSATNSLIWVGSCAAYTEIRYSMQPAPTYPVYRRQELPIFQKMRLRMEFLKRLRLHRAASWKTDRFFGWKTPPWAILLTLKGGDSSIVPVST